MKFGIGYGITDNSCPKYPAKNEKGGYTFPFIGVGDFKAGLYGGVVQIKYVYPRGS